MITLPSDSSTQPHIFFIFSSQATSLFSLGAPYNPQLNSDLVQTISEHSVEQSSKAYLRKLKKPLVEIAEGSVDDKLVPNIPAVHCWYIEGFDTKQEDNETCRTDDNIEMLM